MNWSRTRPTVAGREAAVASAHPLATQAGIDILRRGGNAIDAVVATAVALGVVEPYMSGPGGVGWLLLHQPSTGTTRTLNFSGNSPARATPDQFTLETQTTGPRACLIPGNIAGWFEMLKRHGTLSPDVVFAPAIDLARNGFPLHPFNVKMLHIAGDRLNDAGRAVFFSMPWRFGALLQQADLAASLEQLAERGPDVFYDGPLGHQMADFLQQEGGLLSREDIRDYKPDWEEPIEITYRGLTIKTCAPNNEGFQILQTLKLLEPYDLRGLGHNSVKIIHLMTEAIKLAVADRIEYSGDPRFTSVPLARLLDDAYLAKRRALINLEWASRSMGERWQPGSQTGLVPAGEAGLTTHLAAIDREGNVASITQSLGHGFGSGVMVPGTGIILNSFCHWCDIDPACPGPNLIAPGKRWSSCMAPVQVFRDGQFWFSISTPGSWGILQTVVQMLVNVIDFEADLQAAIEAPRFRIFEGTRVEIESRVDDEVLAGLRAKGHTLDLLEPYSYFVGGGQGVMLDAESGARLAGADPRRDGYAWAF